MASVSSKGYLIRCHEAVDHPDCPHQFGTGAGVRFGRKPAFARTARLCDCDCHQGCPLWPSTEVSFDDWMERCLCPGATWSKDRFRSNEEEHRIRKALVAEVVDEVVEGRPTGRDETLQALEEACQRREVELSNIERQSLPDLVQARLAPRPAKDLLAIKALGGLGFNLIREIRKILSEDEGPAVDED
jgi:hypothetical protein